jgi:signal transduction histidine kinase/HD superfamily phosphohydrolase YqeK
MVLSMHPALSSALRSPHFAPHPESAAAALCLLADSKPEWQKLAAVAARDAAFSHALLVAATLVREEHEQELEPLLARRLELLGGDLLRAWLLHAQPPTAHARFRERVLSHSRITAECARQLAVETAYPRPQEAYLAGLWHDLGRLWLLTVAPDYAEYSGALGTEPALAVEERKRYGQDHAALSSRLAAEGGVPIQVVDAIALHHVLEEQAAVAHPLASLLWAAEALAAEEHESLLGAISRVTGVGESTLLHLRDDAAHVCSSKPSKLSVGKDYGSSLADLTDTGPSSVPRSSLVPVIAGPSLSMPGDYWRNVALQGLLQGSFRGASTEVIGQRLDMACRLLFDQTRPLIVRVGPSEQLVAAPVAGQEVVGRLFDELQMRLDDDASVLALAGRTGAPTSHFPDSANPGRSPRDWHLARWLKTSGLLCLPCDAGEEQCVAIFGIDDQSESRTGGQSLMAILAASAATVLLEKNRRKAAEAALQATSEQRYREHARRVVHEVNNPLTVIRSYLDMIGQRGDTNETLRDELGILNNELDRVGNLLQGVTQAPRANPEAPRSSVTEVLQELRALYGEPLFARRNIEFDLRTIAGLPAARIPPSVLKQVLLNLFRNASEALLDGGKLSVSTPGTLIANGVPCVEMRLIDNGPGIPTERLARLFEPKPSDKPGHQGVGMSICRELLAAWQSSIVCRSQVGTGTSFQIFIPLD